MSASQRIIRFAGVLAVAAVLLGAGRAVAQGRPDCAEVLRSLSSPKASGHGSRHPSALKISEMLGVDPEYVETCAASYGRHFKRRETTQTRPKTDDELDASEKREAEEFDEIAREERDAEGDKYEQTLPGDQENRKKIEHTRNDDTPNEWDAPTEHRGWVPYEDKPWLPFERADDE